MNKRGSSLKTGLLVGFIPIVVFFALAIFVYNHISMRRNINNLIEKRLTLLLNSISVTFKSMVNISLSSYLKGIAEKSKTYAEHNYELVKKGVLSYSFARSSFIEKLKRQKAGENGGVFLIDVSKAADKYKSVIKNNNHIDENSLFVLARKAVSELEGYAVLSQRTAQNKITKKPAYFIYIKKWNWVLIVYCDRKDAKNLINLDVINQDLLDMKIGENGYVGVMDREGNLLIHPWNQSENAYYYRDYGNDNQSRKYVFQQMLKMKKGRIFYYWEYGNGIEKSVMYFNQIKDMDLTLFLSASLEEHYKPLRDNFRMSLIFLLIALLIIIPLTFFIGGSVAKPVIKIASVIKEITNNLEYKEVNVEGNKETRELAVSFNFMISQIREYSQHLEALVEKRAGELARTNEKLELEIKEREEVQKALSHSETMLKLVMDNIPVAIYWKDNNLIYIGCNTLFAKDAGLEDPGEITGKTDYDLGWRNTNAESIRELDKTVLNENKGIYHDIIRMELENGEIIWADVNRLPLHDIEGNVVGILGTYEDITLRKDTEDELNKYREHLEELVEERSSEISKMYVEIKENEGRIKGLLDAVPDIILIFNRDGFILDYHNSGEDSVFSSASIKEDSKLEDFLNKDIRKKLYRILTNPEAAGDVETFSAEIEYSGEIYDYEFRVASSGTSKGIAIVRNVTEKRKAEKEIERLNLFRERIIENADIIIAVLDHKGMPVVWNKAGEIVTGYTREEIALSKHIWNLIIKGNEEKKEAIRVFDRAATYSEIIDDYHTEITTKANEEKVISWNARSLSETGYMGAKGIIAIGRDITDRLKAEKALKSSEERLKLALEAANDGIWDLKLNIDEIYYSPRCYTMLGYQAYEFPSSLENWVDLIHPDDRKRAVGKLETFIKENGQNYENEFRNRAKDGSYRWILTRGKTVEWEKDIPVRVVGTRFDITQRKVAEEEKENLIVKLEDTNSKLESLIEKEIATRYQMEAAYEETRAANEELESAQGELEDTNTKLEKALLKSEEANKVKSEFLAIMSHELRTPLTGMLGFSELLTRDESLSSTQKNFADLIHNAGKRLLNVLSDLLEISVIEAGKINIEYSFFSIDDVIDDVHILLKEEFEKKSIDFIKNISGINKIYSDPSRIRQIFLNLVGNAVKFTKEGYIEVSVKKDKGYYIFKVEDTGIGIKKDNLESIFDSFTQVESYSRRTYGGTGLGLSICKKLVEALKGEIWADSVENKGSIFYFSLPAFNEYEKEISLEKEDEKVMPASEIIVKDDVKILFAEDDEINFKFIEDMLSVEKDVSVNGFTNGKELLDEFKANKNYDIVLLDIQMPLMDGEECLKEIRKLDDKIPVIALTAFAMKSDRSKYLKLGFTDYLSKPLKISKLLDIIDKYGKKSA